MSKTLILVFLIAIMLFSSLSFAVTDDERAQNVLRKAAANLGWPETITQDTDNNGTVGTQYYISSDGTGEDADFRASVVILPTDLMSGFWLNFLSEQVDMDRTTYMGRDAAISKYGKNCNPKPLVKFFNELITGWFEDIFGESDDPDKGCVTDHGAIVFACGKYLMIATDDRSDEGGMEDDFAAALYYAAQEEKLCDYGDTLVILAGTTDKPGGTRLAEYEKIAQDVNVYYGVNAYGKQSFSYTFRDADGSRGTNDWYDVAPTQTGMSEKQFLEAAVKKTFAGADVPQDLTFKRIVVVYSGAASQEDPNAVFSTADGWEKNDYFIEVDAANRKAKIFTTDRIMLSEKDSLGDWSHEFGHSLWWKYKTDGVWNKINDRYNYVGNPNWQYGQVGSWDLMGDGNYLGTPKGSKPSQMSSYTKEAAGWLIYATMNRNQTYREKALESKTAGEIALQFDDPESNDPLFFYVVEARDSFWTYSAPESGVVVYKVAYDAANKHEIVNNLQPQNGTIQANKDGLDYIRATLHGVGSAGDAPIYTNVPGKFRLMLERETASPYSVSIRLDDYVPTNMVGAVVAPNGTAIAGANNDTGVRKDSLGPMPDIDLHAYDDKGGHVGLDYSTGEYENTIPGAISSGDLKDDAEWIFVPEGTSVRYEVSAYKTQQFLNANPQYSAIAKPHEFRTTLMKIDSSGNQFVADGGAGTVSAGQKTATKGPDDTSLTFMAKNYPGFGNNSCAIFPFMILVLSLCIIKWR